MARGISHVHLYRPVKEQNACGVKSDNNTNGQSLFTLKCVTCERCRKTNHYRKYFDFLPS